MKRFLRLIGLLMLVTCQPAPKQAEFVVQVSLGPWDSADYTAEEIIGRIQEVQALIPVRKVIIGWTMDKDIYRQVGEGFRFNCPSRPETAANVVAIHDNHFKDCGFDGAVLS